MVILLYELNIHSKLIHILLTNKLFKGTRKKKEPFLAHNLNRLIRRMLK